MRKKIKIAALVIICALLAITAYVLLFAVPWGITTQQRAAWTPIGEGYSDGAQRAAVNDFQRLFVRGDLTLYANLATAAFFIEDARSGVTWHSNPTNREGDHAIGFDMQQLSSRLIIDVDMVMTEGGHPIRTRFADMQSGVEVSYRLLDDAVVFVFHFDRAELDVPVKISLFDHGFAFELLNAEVFEHGRHRLVQVLALPAFGASREDAAGYMLIPDGSGALIYLNSGSPAMGRLALDMYGFNAGATDGVPSNIGFVTMGLWGKRVNDDGYIAIVTGGAARAGIMAQSGGMGSVFNLIYGTYTFRQTGGVRLVTQGFNEETINITETFPDFENNFRIEYHFLSTGAADYVAMAAFYRRHLGLESRVTPGDIPFYLDVYGHIVRTQPWLGFPRNQVIPTATFAQTADLVQRLYDGGVRNITVNYHYWQRGGYYGRLITNPTPLRALGGTRGLSELNTVVENVGGTLFLAHEPMQVYRTGGGFTPVFDALKTVSRLSQRQMPVNAAGFRDFRYAPWFLVRPQRMAHFFDEFLTNFNQLGIGHVSLNTMGHMLYSELANDGINRDEVLQLIIQLLAQPDLLLLNGAFDYAAAQAHHVINAPARSSGFDIYSRDVPFWQIVFHGYVHFSLHATNLSSNPSDMVLRSLETGARPMFSWVIQQADALIGSRSDYLFGADYTRWVEQAIADYLTINAVLSQVAHEPITAHRRYGTIFVTEYGGWLTVIGNYGTIDREFMGQVIPARGFVVK